MLNSASTAPVSPAYGLEELRAIKRRLVSLFERAEIDTVFIENRWKDALCNIDAAIYCARCGRNKDVTECLRFAAAALREIPVDTLNEVTATRYVVRKMAEYDSQEITITSAEMSEIDGFSVCSIWGTYREEDDANDCIRSFAWTVWLQNGVLYGEW